MALKNLNGQVDALYRAIDRSLVNPTTDSANKVKVEFLKLKSILDSMSSFTEHKWEVKLLFGPGVVSEMLELKAEHLEEARVKAIELYDRFDSAYDYELYCDGKQILDHE